MKKRICALIVALACGGVVWARGGARTAGSARGHGGAAAGPAEMQVVGLIVKEDGKYFLVDEDTAHRFELRGSALARYVGERLVVRGTVSAESASGGTLLVMTVREIGPVAVGAATGKAAAAAVRTGLPKTLIGVAAGVAAGGTIGGLYAAGVIGGGEQAASPN